MKKYILSIIALLVIALAIVATILLVNKKGSPTLENAQRIEEEMTFSKAVRILGEEYIQHPFNQYEWQITDAQYKLYVSFKENSENELVAYKSVLVKIISREEALSIKLGMSEQEVKSALGSDGRSIGSGMYILEWSISDGGRLCVTIHDDKVTSVTIKEKAPSLEDAQKIELSMTYEQLEEIFRCEGTKVSSDVYRWDLDNGSVCYVKFSDGRVNQVTIEP